LLVFGLVFRVLSSCHVLVTIASLYLDPLLV
jgi:hypothetical protein